jgi:hypothetical protein
MLVGERSVLVAVHEEIARIAVHLPATDAWEDEDLDDLDNDDHAPDVINKQYVLL